jgi:2-iminoacetate synthase ThiH
MTADLEALAEGHDLIGIGMAADEARRARHGLHTTFVRVVSVGAAPGEPIPMPPGAGEVRVTGIPGTLDAAVRRVDEVVAAAGNVPVSAYSLADLEALSVREGMTLRALLERLGAAGLELVSEAPVDRLQDARRSIEEVNIAGLAVGRLTVDRVDSADPLPLLRQVADLQRAVAVLRVFAPLPRRINPALPTTGYEDVKRIALARLTVDNIPSIQVDWMLYGPKLAQVALTVGADDLDAVPATDDSPEGARRSPIEEVMRNIRAAGLEPVLRNARFERPA